jgi:hypothetical protein
VDEAVGDRAEFGGGVDSQRRWLGVIDPVGGDLVRERGPGHGVGEDLGDSVALAGAGAAFDADAHDTPGGLDNAGVVVAVLGDLGCFVAIGVGGGHDDLLSPVRVLVTRRGVARRGA